MGHLHSGTRTQTVPHSAFDDGVTPPTSPRRDWTIAVAIITGAAILRLILAAIIPAFPDETYYWDWSRRLAAGYFDHPPAIAWLNRIGDSFLTPLDVFNPIAIRL